jgi:hypothetical protein
MLPTSATGPQECVVVLALDFRSEFFEMLAWVPSYAEWLHSCDMTPAYQYHRRVLKLLQWRCPPTRWWLKSPAHMASIAALDTVYPDAQFVMTHREIGAVLPSVCALMNALTGPLTERDDPESIGRFNTEHWHESLRRLIDFRDAGNEHRFHDVAFADLQADPIAAIDALYARLGDTLDPTTSTRMATWWEESAAARKAPAYSGDMFDLDLPDLTRRFAFYNDRFANAAALANDNEHRM